MIRPEETVGGTMAPRRTRAAQVLEAMDSPSFRRFLVSGGLNTALTYLIFRGVLHLLGPRPGAAAAAQATGYACGIVFSFVANSVWTFRVRMTRGPFARLVTAQLSLLALSSALVELGVGGGRLSPTLVWLLLVVPMTLLNFGVQRYWVFPQPRAARP